MKSILSYTLFVITAALLIAYVLFSTWIHNEAVEKTLIFDQAVKTFLDTITDKGALSERDYSVLVNHLGRTGGAFDITVTVERMYAVPDASGGFVQDYRPAYAFSSRLGDFPYTDGVGNDIIPTQYFRKFDLVTVTIQQTAMMGYQRNQIAQLMQPTHLRSWTFTRGVRSDGNSIINNEPPPISYQ